MQIAIIFNKEMKTILKYCTFDSSIPLSLRTGFRYGNSP
jgi:hypothetical protein